MRIGLVCPYSLDVPGGVQSHVRELAAALAARGHTVGVLAPGEGGLDDPPYIERVGRAVAVPYNGSVARLAFGPRVAARTRAWLRDGRFDVLHVHEPATPSLSLLALWQAEAPVVATFHTSHDRSWAMSSVSAIMRPSLEKVAGRIAVSPQARETMVRYLGGDPVVIPNGIDHASFASAEGLPRTGERVVFLGRVDEPRKGLPVALAAFAALAGAHPGARLLVAGHGGDGWLSTVPDALRDRVEYLGTVSDRDRASLLAGADVYLAPQTGGESFGLVVAEAMAAGAAVVASDLPAFRAVLDDGRCGRLVPPGDAAAMASAASGLLGDPEFRARLGERAQAESKRFDWAEVVPDIEAVYDAVLPTGSRMSVR